MKCEICELENIRLHRHHIQSKSKGGKNNSNNLCYLCPNCHTKTHDGDIIIEGKFDSTNGKILIWRNKSELPKITSSPPEVYIVKGEKK